MRLIDAEALKNEIKEAIEVLEKDLLLGRGNWFSEIKLLWYKKILKIVNNAPTIEAKPVVHCKNCKCYEFMSSENKYFCNKYGGYVTENDYCSRCEVEK